MALESAASMRSSTSAAGDPIFQADDGRQRQPGRRGPNLGSAAAA